MANILLLRSPSQDTPDRYESCFSSAGYHPLSIPVLETVLTNLDDLRQIIRDGPASQNYAGVILTSGRACEAWRNVVEDLLNNSPPAEVRPVEWSSVPFYAVGKATASALVDIEHLFKDSPHVPKDIRGEHSGTSEQLAHFILTDLDGTQGRLLYLTGDKNRDTLSNILNDGGVELGCLKVYETQGSSSFSKDLDIASGSRETDRWWIVFFAPSAAEFVIPILRNYFVFKMVHATASTSSLLPEPSIAAIGPTTANFIRDALGMRVDIVAKKPTPEELASAIVAHDEQT